MKKLEMFIRPEKLEYVKEIFNEAKVFGITVTMVSGCGLQKGKVEMYRGVEFSLNLLPKIKVESVVRDDIVEYLIEKITSTIKTGNVGDGKIFIYDVEDAVRIRTSERGNDAI